MNPKLKTVLACTLLLAAHNGSPAQTSLGEIGGELNERYRPVGGSEPCVQPSIYRRYGSASYHRFTFLETPRDKRPAPLVIFVDGLRSRMPLQRFPFPCLPKRLGEQGFAFALAFHGKVPSQQSADEAVADMARAIALLVGEAGQRGLDPQRIVIAGHELGGQVAALLGTDPHWLEQAGVPFSSVRGIYVVDGEGLDLLNPAANEHSFERQFRGDPERRKALSPMSHAARPNAPAFLLQSTSDNRSAIDQSRAFCDALASAGTDASCETIPQPSELDERTHLGGRSDNQPTKSLLEFLSKTK